MKTCAHCKEAKTLSAFGPDFRRSDGLRRECIECTRALGREGYARNREKYAERSRLRMIEWRTLPGNAERNREAALRWYRENAENAEIAKARAKEWRKLNPERKKAADANWRNANQGIVNAHTKKYKVRKRKAVPAWANLFLIEEIYDLAARRTQLLGFPWHVDHIIPLQGKLVSGLHVETNLAVVPATRNMSKGNKYLPDMYCAVDEKPADRLA